MLTKINTLPSLFTLILVIIHMHGGTHGEECGTRFTDFASSAYLADVVLKGKVMTFNPTPLARNTRSANISVSDVFKGMQVLKSSGGMDTGGYLIVHNFGQENRADCIVSDSDTIKDHPMVFFLRQTSDRNNNNMIEHSALPVPADGDENTRVRRSVCDTCVEPPRITRVVCKACAFTPVITRLKARKARIGRRTRLRCKAKGKPAPTFSWLHNQLSVVPGDDDINIRDTTYVSILEIRRTSSNHEGRYTCIATNELGKAEEVTSLNVLTTNQRRREEPNQISVKDAADRVLCNSNPCLNGGTCYFSQSLDLSMCVCSQGYEGVQCENSLATNTRSNVAEPNANQNENDMSDNSRARFTSPSTPFPKNSTTRSINNRENVFRNDGDRDNDNDVDNSDDDIDNDEDSDDDNNDEDGDDDDDDDDDDNDDDDDVENDDDYDNNDNDENEHLKRFCLLQILCLNGGTCSITPTEKTFCTCIHGYTGPRCEVEAEVEDSRTQDISTTFSTNTPSSPSDYSPTVRSSSHASNTKIDDVTIPTSSRSPSTSRSTTNTSSVAVNINHAGTIESNFKVMIKSSPAPNHEINRNLFNNNLGNNRPQIDNNKNNDNNYNNISPTVRGVSSTSSTRHSYTRLKSNAKSPSIVGYGQRLFKYPVKRKSSLKIIPCKDKHFCLNRGKCRYISKLDKKYCHCRTGYIGTRCERRLN